MNNHGRTITWYLGNEITGDLNVNSRFHEFMHRAAYNYALKAKLLIPFKGEMLLSSRNSVLLEDIDPAIENEMAKTQDWVYSQLGYVVPFSSRAYKHRLAVEYLLSTCLCVIFSKSKDSTEAYLATKSIDILQALNGLKEPKKIEKYADLLCPTGTNTTIIRVDYTPEGYTTSKKSLSTKNNNITIISAYAVNIFLEGLIRILQNCNSKIYITRYTGESQVGLLTSLNPKILKEHFRSSKVIENIYRQVRKPGEFASLYLPNLQEQELEMVRLQDMIMFQKYV
jgi:hypothetical protein